MDNTDKLFSDRLLYMILTCFCFLLYGKTLSYDISWLDDVYLLVKSKPVLSDFTNFFSLFVKGVYLDGSQNFMYRPLLNVAFMADIFLNSENYYFSHFINIVFHSAAVCCLFAFLKLFFKNRTAAFLLTFVFAAHPSGSVAVSWIPGRNDSLLAIFVFSAFVFLEKYRRDGKNRHIILYSLCFAGAMFSKESAIVFPFLCALWLWIKRKEGNISLRIFSAYSFIPLIIWFFLRQAADISMKSFDFIGTIRNMSYFPVVAGKVILPIEPVVSSEYKNLEYPFISSFVAASFLVLSFLFILRNSKKSQYKSYMPVKIFSFGVFWFLLFLLPTFAAGSNFGNSFFEHRFYVPMAGIFIIISQISIPRKFNKLCLVLGLILIMEFSSISFCHSSYYKNRDVFWTRLVQENQSDFVLYVWKGMFEEERFLYGSAEYYYRKSLELNPRQPVIHEKLAKIAYIQGNYKKAKEEIEEETRIFPGNANLEQLLEELKKNYKE